MKKTFLTSYVPTWLWAIALTNVLIMGAERFNTKRLEKDAEQLSAPVNDTHHVEIYPDVFISPTTGILHDFSRARIAANDPTKISYTYNIATGKIEGYELNPKDLPDFLRDKKSLAAIHQTACTTLATYKPLDYFFKSFDSFLMNNRITNQIDKRQASVQYLHRNFCQ